MDLITEYKCPSCGAPLAFDPAAGRVKCEHCGSEFEVGEVVQANMSDEESTTAFNWGDYKSSLSGERLDNVVVYKCVSCGAEIEADPNTVATKCPYCDNNVVISDRLSGGLKPNCIIPFEISKEQLPGIVKRFYGDKSLLPKNFLTQSQIEKSQGVYVPFWLFDCEISGQAVFDAEKTSMRSNGRETISTTYHYLVKRGGTLRFKNVPVDASTKMDDDMMDSLEPFDYSKLRDFQSAYLSGFVADRFDSDPDREIPRANERTINSAYSMARSTIHGYGSVIPRSNNFRMNRASVKYAMLPVYIINCKYAGKDYRYAINGQTGKIVGELPIDKSLAARKFVKGFLVAAALSFAALMFL